MRDQAQTPPNAIPERQAELARQALKTAQVVDYAVQVLGTRDHVLRWLQSPNRALGGVTPATLLSTGAETDADQVEELLGRIEHGIYS